MRHVRFDVHRLALDGEDLPLAYGDVLVADQDGNTDLEWELQVVLLADRTIERAPCALSLRLLDGRQVDGDAFLVRSQERMHVFRGTGPLTGVTREELT